MNEDENDDIYNLDYYNQNILFYDNQKYTKNLNLKLIGDELVNIKIIYTRMFADICISLAEKKEKKKYLNLAINLYYEILKTHNEKYYPFFIKSLKINLGNAYINLSKIEDEEKNLNLAINCYNECFYLYSQVLKKYSKEENKKYLIDFYVTLKMNLGHAYFDLSKIEDEEKNLNLAINCYIKSINTYNKILEIANEFDIGITKINLGDCYYFISAIKTEDKEKNLNLAINYYNEGFYLYSQVLKKHNMYSFPDNFGITKMNLGNAYFDLSKIENEEKNLNLAINCYNEALEFSNNGYQKITIYKNYRILLNYQKKYNDLYNLLEKAIKWFEDRRLLLLKEENKKTFFEEFKEIYFYGIQNSLILLIEAEYKNDIEEQKKLKKSLFRYIELSKTRSLIDIINSENGRVIFDESLAEGDINLIKKINLLNKLEEDLVNISKLEQSLLLDITNIRSFKEVKLNPEKLKEVETRKDILEKERNNLLEDLYKYPNIKSRLSMINGKTIELEEFQEILKENFKDTVAIQYYFIDTFYIINIISSEKIETLIKGGNNNNNELLELNKNLDLYYKLISDNKISNKEEKYYEIGENIYKLLYKPAEEFFPDSTKRIMFLTNSKLHNFAFNLLRNEKSKYIIETGIQFYKILNASMLISLKDKSKSDFKNIKIMAISDYNNSPLLAIKDEIEGRNYFIEQLETKEDSEILENNQVTIESFKNILKSECSILNLMGHGYAEKNDAGYIYIDKATDKKLSISQIYRSFPSLKNNKITILELCKSGYQLSFGEEVASINTVFFMIGAGATLSNIIDLNDTFAEEFFKDFFEILTKKINKNPKYEKKDLLDIFYEVILNKIDYTIDPELWAFLEFQGNPNF